MKTALGYPDPEPRDPVTGALIPVWDASTWITGAPPEWRISPGTLATTTNASTMTWTMCI